MRVHVEDVKVKHAASKLGCLTLKCPFTYLGTKVGGSMSRVEAWKDVVDKEIRVLSNQGVRVLDYMRLKLGNGEMAAFWADNWSGKVLLRDLFPRLYALENDKLVSVCSKLNEPHLDVSFRRTTRGGAKQVQFNALLDMISFINLVPMVDRWVWTLENSGDFSYVEVDSYEEWLAWLASFRLVANLKRLIKGVFYVSWWSSWTYRNKLLFDDKAPLKELIFDNIVSNSFHWCSSRCKASFSWNEWLKNPYLLSL
nr:RNA-directed DNA polymerase, eukaryota, reverse transcriptase zinc-binding domain protein [Tanacetum cinerariifolium]